MQTAIGRGLRLSRKTLALASAIGALVVAVDLALVWWNHYPESIEGRGVLAVLALTAHVWLVQGDLTSVGLRSTPLQGWWFWCRASLWIGVAVAVFIVVGLRVWVACGHELPIYVTHPGDIGVSFLGMCVIAPVLEEVTYRFALCVPLAGLLGPWRAATISGLAFGSLHVVYGNPSPENLVGGFFLAWAFLKSESIVVPVLLHSLGNLCVLAIQVGGWYWLGGGQ